MKASEQARENMRIAFKGRKISIEHRLKLSMALRGEKSHLWRGGKTEQSKLLRTSLEYRLWREAVFERDDYTCQMCLSRGGRLNADHIKPFALYPELRLAIDNGRVLCESCHRLTPTWGRPTSEKARSYYAK